ncbi:MAG: glycosyltransferase family 4 protein [Thermogemmata sp.]
MPIEILPNFVDTEKFLPNDAEAEEGLIVFAGTVCEKKGVRQLIAAMPAILASVPHARLIIAGRDQMEAPGGGSFVEYLKSLMGPLVRERTVFLGPLRHSDLPGLLRKANVCVFPSHSESQGIVFLEAMATGKPQVAPRIPPVLEMMREGEHALFCDPREPESIAAAVVRLLKDPDLRARLGRAARERVVREFSAEVMVPRNIEFYERVLGMR